MILNSLILENIRSYTHEEVEFSRGISLFEGDIGSGKSTVLMAIEFALFGLGSQKAESLLSKKSQDGYAILEFTVNGTKCEVKRGLKRKSTGVSQDPKNCWIRVDGQKEPLSPSELKQRVLQILKFNEPSDPKAESRIFRYAIFTPQEAMKEVLSDFRKRLETIRKAFGIEDYQMAAQNANFLLGELKSEVRILKERFSNISEIEYEIKKSHEKVSSIESLIQKLAISEKKLSTDESDKKSQLDQLRKKDSERITLSTKFDSLSEKIDDANSRINSKKNEITELEEQLKQTNSQLIELDEISSPTLLSLSEINKKLDQFQKINDDLIKSTSNKENILENISKLKDSLGKHLNDDLDSLRKSLSELKETHSKLIIDSESTNKKSDSIKDDISSKQAIVDLLNNEIESFSKLGNSCPTCKQEITSEHHHQLVDVKKDKVTKLEGELNELKNSFFESRSILKDITEKLESNVSGIQEIETVLIPGITQITEENNTLEKIETKISQLNSLIPDEFGDKPIEHLTALKDSLIRFENLQSQKNQLSQTKTNNENLMKKFHSELDSLHNDISEFDSQKTELKTQLDSLDDISLQISSTESELDEINSELNNARQNLAVHNESLKNESEKITQNNSKLELSLKWKKQYDVTIQYKEWLDEFFIPTISQIEKQVMLSILQNFNETYRRWYSILVEDPTKESRIDENFTPIVHQDGYDQEINFLSGGEKTSIALAYRLTLNSLMRHEMDSMKSNLLILDEPTDGFSKNQLGKIRELLNQLQSEQIILVSHEKELETYVDKIFHISKQDGISKISPMT